VRHPDGPANSSKSNCPASLRIRDKDIDHSWLIPRYTQPSQCGPACDDAGRAGVDHRGYVFLIGRGLARLRQVSAWEQSLPGTTGPYLVQHTIAGHPAGEGLLPADDFQLPVEDAR
jgi:hypothetical protein